MVIHSDSAYNVSVRSIALEREGRQRTGAERSTGRVVLAVEAVRSNRIRTLFLAITRRIRGRRPCRRKSRGTRPTAIVWGLHEISEVRRGWRGGCFWGVGETVRTGGWKCEASIASVGSTVTAISGLRGVWRLRGVRGLRGIRRLRGIWRLRGIRWLSRIWRLGQIRWGWRRIRRGVRWMIVGVRVGTVEVRRRRRRWRVVGKIGWVLRGIASTGTWGGAARGAVTMVVARHLWHDWAQHWATHGINTPGTMPAPQHSNTRARTLPFTHLTLPHAKHTHTLLTYAFYVLIGKKSQILSTAYNRWYMNKYYKILTIFSSVINKFYLNDFDSVLWIYLYFITLMLR